MKDSIDEEVGIKPLVREIITWYKQQLEDRKLMIKNKFLHNIECDFYCGDCKCFVICKYGEYLPNKATKFVSYLRLKDV